MRSSGRTPIAPLITDRCRVVSLSARIRDGRFRPVSPQAGCVAVTATVWADAEAAAEAVINATIKSSGESQRASTRQGRRFDAVRSLNGNEAWMISPGWNIRGLLS